MVNSESSWPFTKLRPFNRSDLIDIPENWKIKGPDFIGIGYPKAGTSWWYNLLLKHPQIENNRLKRKELRYFIHFGYKGLTDYESQVYKEAFASPENSICGEFTPIYIFHPFCVNYIAQIVPNCKLIVLLRNPVKSFVSFLNEAGYRISNYNFNQDQKNVFTKFNTIPRGIRANLFANDLMILFTLFKKEQILILQYEKCKKHPEEELARTFEFLGVDKLFSPKQIKYLKNG